MLLRSGQVLLAGGVKDTPGGAGPTASAEIFDPVTADLHGGGDGDERRADAGAGVLPPGVTTGADADGWVLIAGGRATRVRAGDDRDLRRGGEHVPGDGPVERPVQARMGLTPDGDDCSAKYGAVAAGGMASPPVNSARAVRPRCRDVDGSPGATMRAGAGVAHGGDAGRREGALRGRPDERGRDDADGPGGHLRRGGRPDAAAERATGSRRMRDRGGVRGARVRDAAAGPGGGLRRDMNTGARRRTCGVRPADVDGFNDSPQAQVKTPTTPEPYLFGVRMYWRAFDRKGPGADRRRSSRSGRPRPTTPGCCRRG